PRCRAELRDHQETAALLAHAGTAAPEGVWERITAKLDEAPPLPDTALALFSSRRSQPRVVTWGASLLAAAAVIGALFAVGAMREPSSTPSLQAFADRALNVAGSRVATLRQPDGTVVADVVIT